jgi:hypothetical protein
MGRHVQRKVLALILVAGCGGEPSPRSAVVEAQPAPTALAAATSATTAAPPLTPSALDAPPNDPDMPAYTTLADLERAPAGEGLWFFDARFVAMQSNCGPCPPVPPCSPSPRRPCPRAPNCAPCRPPELAVADGALTVKVVCAQIPSHPLLVPGNQIRLVVRRMIGGQLFLERVSEPCPPSECLETEPATPLELAPAGIEVRRAGERCYARTGCPPNAKCDPTRESRVRCPPQGG